MAQENEIQAWKEEIRVLKVRRGEAETQLRGTSLDHDKEQTRLYNQIDNLSKEIIAMRNQITATLKAQQQGKFMLYFSIFSFILNNILLPISQTYYVYCCLLLYRLDRFGISSATAGTYY